MELDKWDRRCITYAPFVIIGMLVAHSCGSVGRHVETIDRLDAIEQRLPAPGEAAVTEAQLDWQLDGLHDSNVIMSSELSQAQNRLDRLEQGLRTVIRETSDEGDWR